MDCYIFAAAPTGDIPPIPKGSGIVIAADAGLISAERLGLTPELAIGDFDSLGTAPPPGVRTERYPIEKDDTDTGLAVKAGLKASADRFFIFGGMGGERPDHTVANMQTLLFIASLKKTGFLTDGNTAIVALSGASRAVFPENYRGNISIFSANGIAEGVTLKGLKYTLDDASLTCEHPLGVSNSFLESTPDVSRRGNSPRNAEISLKRGALWIFFDCTEKALSQYPTLSFD